MKKIISALLCAALSVLSIVSASAVELAFDSQTNLSNSYKIISEDNIPNNQVRIYKSGKNFDKTAGVIFEDLSSSKKDTKQYFNFSTPSVSLSLSSKSGYNIWTLLQEGSGGNDNNIYKFNNAGGTYQKIRIKLSDYSNYFNDNGTHTKSFFDREAHNYNFTNEGDGHSSMLAFISGGAITAVAPDNNGMAEIYFSTKLGAETCFITDFVENSASGGGTTGYVFSGFTIGDTDINGYVSVKDATLIQKHLGSLVTLDKLGLRNSDTNHDGIINILDATEIQKYLADLI